MSSFPEADDWREVEWLDRLAQLRLPVDPLNRRIVEHVCRRCLAPATFEGRYLEIGAGDGKLRDWLPDEIRFRTVHSEPSPEFCDRFRQRFPAAELCSASVYELPYTEKTFSAVFGLCVLDALDDLDRACEEIHRVLNPGGCLVHFLDLGLACMDDILAEQFREGQVPFPNFLGELDSASASSPDDGSLVKDLMVCRRERFLEISRYLAGTGNRLADELADYDRHLQGSPQDAARFFMSLTNDPIRRKRLVQVIADIERLVGCYPSLAWDWQPVSSIGLFERRLKQCFSPENGFRIEHSRILVAREWQPALPLIGDDKRHFARIVGQVALRKQVTAFEYGDVIAEDGVQTSETELLVESGLHVFVATACGPDSQTDSDEQSRR